MSAWVVDEHTSTLSMRKAEADGRGSQGGGEKAAPTPPFSVSVDHVFGPQRDTEAVFQATARVRPSLHPAAALSLSFSLSRRHTLRSEGVCLHGVERRRSPH